MLRITYPYRSLARVILEAKTPLCISSGEKDLKSDSLCIKDANGLPYIPGTSIAGVLRSHCLDESQRESVFGFNYIDRGEGSRIIISDAKLLDENGTPIDGIISRKSDFLLRYMDLPVRQHVKIGSNGTAEPTGKFDNEVVFKGSRFCFEAELVGIKESDVNVLSEILSRMCSVSFRLGGGSRKGYGEVEVVSYKTATLNLSDPQGKSLYLSKSSELSKSGVWSGWNNADIPPIDLEEYDRYTMKLVPEDFFIFGSGFGDEQADMVQVKESVISWEKGKAEFKDNAILIPASSVKGAIAHRVAYHYNRAVGIFADCNFSISENFGYNNKAVQTLFGSADPNNMKRGEVLFSDLIETQKVSEKVLSHVVIDDFTGGGIDGGLFFEKTIQSQAEYELDLYVHKPAIRDEQIKDAFERTLEDICDGLLPLGEGSNRGNGIFGGKLLKNGEEIWAQSK